MSNLIYSCIFFNKDYLALANLLLESFTRHTPSATKYLLITNALYQKQVQELLDTHQIDGEVLCMNSVVTKFHACAARLGIFSYPNIDLYDKILYLDLDILITGSLDPILDFDLEEKLYCYNQDVSLNDWGRSKQLFVENNCDIDFDRTVFSTCVMLFKNCDRMKSLFLDILTHIKKRVPGDYDLDGAFEEDFVIYQCFIQECYDDVFLTQYTRDSCMVVEEQMILNHFCAQQKVLCGTPVGKLDRMLLYLSRVDAKNYGRNIIHIGANEGDCPTTKALEYEPYHSVSVNDNCIFVEPIPYLFKKLVENYNTKYPNNNFVFINKAVSDSIGEVEMVMASEENDFDKEGLGWFPYCSSIDLDFISKHEKIWNTDPIITEIIKVPTTTLDEIIENSGMTKIDLLIIDAEGHDFHVLMPYDFSILPKKIIFEYHMMNPNHLALLKAELLLKGYSIMYITELDMIMELK